MVHGSWFMVHGSWVHGFMGSWVHGSWFMVHGFMSSWVHGFMHTHVMKRSGSCGIRSPADRLELAKEERSKPDYRTEHVRRSSDIPVIAAPQPLPIEWNTVQSSLDLLPTYWTKPVRFPGFH
jgi:hypothetical protein